jgi:hypothetical protein
MHVVRSAPTEQVDASSAASTGQKVEERFEARRQWIVFIADTGSVA